MPDTATFDFQPAQAAASPQFDFQPEAIDFQPVQDEAPPAFDFQPVAPPMPSVRDVMKMSLPWTTRQNASAAIDRATSLPASPPLPPAQNRLSIAPPHQGTATQEVERQAAPPLTLQPTAKPTPLAPPPEKQNQITPVPRPALGQPTLPAPQSTEPKQNVTLVSTGFGTGTWIANDNTIEARQQAAQLNAAQGEAVRGVTGVAGLPTIAGGLKTLVPTSTLQYFLRTNEFPPRIKMLLGTLYSDPVQSEIKRESSVESRIAAPGESEGDDFPPPRRNRRRLLSRFVANTST